ARRQYERIGVVLTDGAVEVVDERGERNPVLDEFVNAVRAIGIEADLRGELAALVDGGLRVDTEGRSHFGRIDQVQVVRPAFGEVFPRVRGGVGGDVLRLPVGRRAARVVGVEGRVIGNPFVAEEPAELVE